MNPHDRRAQMEARNSAMRQQVNSLLAGLNRQSAALQKAQVQAAEVTGHASSADGLVTVTVNAAGIVTDVQFAPSAFDRSTPDKLARSVVTVTQQAANAAQRQVEDALAPARGELPDLPDVVPGAPSLKDLLPNMSSTSRRPQRSAEDDDEDFSSRSVLRGGDR
ncbi:MAG: YbaB/EbfC family nucleoid-associated protein [Actinomycetota bacterium]|nr:YbaB/EbfC family nucleoid-associated protein [Actinomycetota bacterium]